MLIAFYKGLISFLLQLNRIVSNWYIRLPTACRNKKNITRSKLDVSSFYSIWRFE